MNSSLSNTQTRKVDHTPSSKSEHSQNYSKSFEDKSGEWVENIIYISVLIQWEVQWSFQNGLNTRNVTEHRDGAPLTKWPY